MLQDDLRVASSWAAASTARATSSSRPAPSAASRSRSPRPVDRAQVRARRHEVERQFARPAQQLDAHAAADAVAAEQRCSVSTSPVALRRRAGCGRRPDSGVLGRPVLQHLVYRRPRSARPVRDGRPCAAPPARSRRRCRASARRTRPWRSSSAEDPARRRPRHREAQRLRAGEDRGVDADHARPRVEQRAARVAGVQARVGLDHVVDQAAVLRPQRAAERRHDAGRSPSGRGRAGCRSRSTTWPTRSRSESPELAGAAAASDADAQQREVGVGVAADSSAACSLPSSSVAAMRPPAPATWWFVSR